MTLLHVGCLPFPTYQGTQAAIAAMLQSSSRLGRDVRLLTYSGAAYSPNVPYPIHRIPDFPRVRSLRSGPSWGKIALDARAVLELRRLCAQIRPTAIVAHHVEAALAAIGARKAPFLYVAHTSLEQELPIYFSKMASAPIACLAGAVESLIVRKASGVGVVAPTLGASFEAPTTYLPIPWQRVAPCPPSPAEARSRLGLPQGVRVCLYAGNLDRYQGWEDLIAALGFLRRAGDDVRLLIATESDPTPARARARRVGLESAVHFCRLDGESTRARAHAAADLAWVPRRTPGGLPIKMLDAFARGIPVIATSRATAGLPIDDACVRTPDDDPRALSGAAATLLSDPRQAIRLRDRAHAYLARAHSTTAFDGAMERLLGRARRSRSVLRRRPT